MESFLVDERVPKAARDFLGGVFESRSARDTDEASNSWSVSRWLGLFRTRDGSRSPGMIDSLYNSVVLLQHHLARSQFQAMPPAMLIEPNLEGVGLFDFHLGDALVDEGARATREVLGR